VQQYPTVPLADVYQLIAYYLKHIQELRTYLDSRRGQAEQVQRENESRWSPDGVRQRLLSRRSP
jgi:hypothetical protein